jgi:flagellin-like protein
MIKKRGLSPVVATVLLIAIVVIIALIVFFWLRGTIQEAVTKFDGTNIQLVCNQVAFDAEYSAGQIFLSNTGNVPIYQFKVRLQEVSGAFSTVAVGVDDDLWPEGGLNQGGVYSGVLDSGSATRMFVIPVLLGKTQSEKRETYTCGDSFAKEITI